MGGREGGGEGTLQKASPHQTSSPSSPPFPERLSGMRLVVDAHKMIKGDVCSAGWWKGWHGRAVLHGAHIRAVLQHVRGEGVTQGVRRQMLRQSGAFADLVENPRRLPPVEPLASVAHEKGFFGGRGDERAP